jgi:hypothetical protein
MTRFRRGLLTPPGPQDRAWHDAGLLGRITLAEFFGVPVAGITGTGAGDLPLGGSGDGTVSGGGGGGPGTLNVLAQGNSLASTTGVTTPSVTITAGRPVFVIFMDSGVDPTSGPAHTLSGAGQTWTEIWGAPVAGDDSAYTRMSIWTSSATVGGSGALTIGTQPISTHAFAVLEFQPPAGSTASLGTEVEATSAVNTTSNSVALSAADQWVALSGASKASAYASLTATPRSGWTEAAEQVAIDSGWLVAVHAQLSPLGGDTDASVSWSQLVNIPLIAVPVTITGGGGGTITGTGAGDLPLGGTATGAVAVAGTGQGSLDLAGSGAGAVQVAGIGAGDLPLAGTGSGAAAVTGSGSGDLPLAGSGAGAVDVTGQGAGTLPLGGDGAGTVDSAGTVTGTGAGDLPLGGTAAGTVGVAGQGAGDLPLAGTGSGAAAVAGSGSGDLPLAGSGQGTVAVTGTGAGVLDITGAGQGAVEVAGQGAGTLPLGGTGDGQAGDAPAYPTGRLAFASREDRRGEVMTTPRRVGEILNPGPRDGILLNPGRRKGEILNPTRDGDTLELNE